MRDVEGFTDRYLDGFAGHPATLADPLVARFLEVWQAEERGHARALAMFLDRYAQRRGVRVPPPAAASPAAPPIAERLLCRVRGPVGRVVTAAHMTWGAANELLTLTGYRLLAARCGHPVLAELLRRIAADEARHYSFYLLQAEWRLAASPTARRVVRHVLARSWTPVGVGEGFKPPEAFARVAAYLTAGAEGPRIVARMDRRLAALPGLAGLAVYSAALAGAKWTMPAPRPVEAGRFADARPLSAGARRSARGLRPAPRP
jgi:rubrerythrin